MSIGLTSYKEPRTLENLKEAPNARKRLYKKAYTIPDKLKHTNRPSISCYNRKVDYAQHDLENFVYIRSQGEGKEYQYVHKKQEYRDVDRFVKLPHHQNEREGAPW